MAGGYAEDSLPLGSFSTSLIYSAQYWQFVDIFIYFSHARVAIPPPVWTNAAHRNGVKVLGTFITEGTEGAVENLRLIYGPNFNPDDDAVYPRFSKFYADKLVEMAKYYKFDGWFLNIEADVRGERDAFAMVDFLKYLTDKLHAECPESLVLWYDSLTTLGKVRWQDHLSLLNKPFFDVTDGCFVNYTWKADYPSKSALLAESRPHQVYTGIDVWGRNTFGGGGHNCHKALRVIKEAKTSCAIFGPAWNYEHLGKELVGKSERRFWVDMEERGVRVPRGPKGEIPRTAEDPEDIGVIRDYLTERASPGTDLFYSDFDQGYGESYCVGGELVYAGPWSNLSRQSIPPTYRTTSDYIPITINIPARSFEHDSKPRLAVSTDVANAEAWNGGSVFVASLKRKFSGAETDVTGGEGKVEAVIVRMFKLGVEIRGDGKGAHVLGVRVRFVDSEVGGGDLGVFLKITDGEGKEREVLVFGGSVAVPNEREDGAEVMGGSEWVLLEVDLGAVLEDLGVKGGAVVRETGVVLFAGGLEIAYDGGLLVVERKGGGKVEVGGLARRSSMGKEEYRLLHKIHIGELRIVPNKAEATTSVTLWPITISNVIFMPGRRVPPTPSGAFLTVQWQANGTEEVERYEVFVDEKWVGGVVGRRCRTWVDLESGGGRFRVLVVAFGRDGAE
ncbi:hypothetical protein HK097_000384, partial [Rhizophlyctis rosea]